MTSSSAHWMAASILLMFIPQTTSADLVTLTTATNGLDAEGRDPNNDLIFQINTAATTMFVGHGGSLPNSRAILEFQLPPSLSGRAVTNAQLSLNSNGGVGMNRFHIYGYFGNGTAENNDFLTLEKLLLTTQSPGTADLIYADAGLADFLQQAIDNSASHAGFLFVDDEMTVPDDYRIRSAEFPSTRSDVFAPTLQMNVVAVPEPAMVPACVVLILLALACQRLAAKNRSIRSTNQRT